MEEVGLSQTFSKSCGPKEQSLSVMEVMFQPESCLLSRLGLSLVPEK